MNKFLKLVFIMVLIFAVLIGVVYVAGDKSAKLSVYNRLQQLNYSESTLNQIDDLNELKQLLNSNVLTSVASKENQVSNHIKFITSMNVLFDFAEFNLLHLNEPDTDETNSVLNKITTLINEIGETNNRLEMLIDYLGDENKTEQDLLNVYGLYDTEVKEQLTLLKELTVDLIDYVYDNSSNSNTTLYDTLINAQVYFANIVFENEISTGTDNYVLNEELRVITAKFASFMNGGASEDTSQSALNFIDAYNNFEYKDIYFESQNKDAFVMNSANFGANSVVQQDYAVIINYFLFKTTSY